MKKIFLYTIIQLFLCIQTFGEPVTAAKGVIERRIPEIKDRITLIYVPQTTSKEFFEIECSNGHLTVRGNSAVALCRGTYQYLKEKCGCLIVWEGSQLNIPETLPDQKPFRVEASVPLRQHFNVVTFGYSTAFWDWNRWEFEIDWMALHGINMPLAMTGQEKIWQKVWKHYGLSDEDLNDYFTGPGFLPWYRMGNIYGNDDKVLEMLGKSVSGQTLPQSFIENDAKMQKRILKREIELGMKPIIPGFSGFIPRALKKKYPELNTWEPTQWNFACRSSLALHGLDPMFQEITNTYIETYKRFYGDVSHYYLIDLFNEIDPPANIKREDLSQITKSVYHSLCQKDPKAVWVIQGWCFFYQRYWQNTDNTKAFLKEIPNDKMIVIDLNADASEVFRSHPNSIACKQVIWSLLNDNWGQRTPLHGNLQKIADKPMQALRDLDQNLIGMGNSSEGIENNSVCFELLYDNAWRQTAVNLSQWLKQYAQQRYGCKQELISDIWNDIYELYYKNNTHDQILPYQCIPNKNIGKCDSINKTEKELILKMLSTPSYVQNNVLFQRDLVDVVKNYVGNNIRTSIWKVQNAIEQKSDKINLYREEFNCIMDNLDALLHTQKNYRLNHWIKQARAYVPYKDKNYLEKNARLQVTTWVAPNWQGYARKEWSGLIGDFYKTRWNIFFDEIAKDKFDQKVFEKEIFDWSNNWCSKTKLYKSKSCNVINQTKLLLELVENLYKNSDNLQ